MSLISLDKIDHYSYGITTGRVEAVDSDTVYICSEKSRALFYIKTPPGYTCCTGDIIRLTFEKTGNRFWATNIELLNKPVSSPTADTTSPYHKLHRNNKRLLTTLYNRQKFFSGIRRFFTDKGFLELHTPTLVESPGVENHIEPFSTTYYDYSNHSHQYYLPTSPEFSLKEALSAGLENIFEIAKVFRNNGEKSNLHAPGFFMLEWYRSYKDYRMIMEDCRDLLEYMSMAVYNNNIIEINGTPCDFGKIDMIPVKTLFAEYSINLDDYTLNPDQFITDSAGILQLSQKYITENKLTKEDIYFKLFLEKIEPGLGHECPVIIYEYPAEMAALSKVCDDNPLYAKRFELYIGGTELANAYEELIDPVEQKRRFNETLEYRAAHGLEKLAIPTRFLKALKYGLPPCSGIALGVERLFMLLEGLSSLEETNLICM